MTCTPFIDAGDCIAEACGWLDSIADGDFVATQDDVEQAEYHLMRACDTLHSLGFDVVQVGEEATAAGPMPIMEEQTADPVAARAYRDLEALSQDVLRKVRAGSLPVADIEGLRGFIERDPEYRERARAEKGYLESQMDNSPY